MSGGSRALTNQLLAALPESEYQRLAPHLTHISLHSGQTLYGPDEPIRTVYFPNQAMVSLISIMEDGSTTEVGLVGNEGMLGLPAVWGGEFTPNHTVVQIASSAMQLRADVLKQEFNRGEALQRLILLYTQALFVQVAQNAACNRQHSVGERLARWLLSVHDCVQRNELPLTQELIGNMLGIRRSSVTVTANILQQAGIIRYSRGRISIQNRRALEARACECYRLIQQQYSRLLGSKRN